MATAMTLRGETDYGPGDHRYNDDLLLAEPARERARREHSTVFHLLDYDKLRNAFRPKNNSSNCAKRQSHVAGFWAVIAALAALTSAASEPLWAHSAQPWPSAIAIASALMGLLSFSVGARGLLYGSRKAAWLHTRLYTERVRQFHFQTFVWRLQEIAESLRSERSQSEYRMKRDQWFSAFNNELNIDGEVALTEVVSPTNVPKMWLHTNASDTDEPSAPDGLDLADVFRAYEVFRFAEQQGYAEYMLRSGNSPDRTKGSEQRTRRINWPWYPGVDLPLRVKRRVLNLLWISALVVLVLMHVVILLSHLAGWRGFGGSWAHATVVSVALLGVAIKTLSEGFALTREVERYEEYRAVVSALWQIFREASSPRQKLHAMVEMEKASFEEMRMFLRSHHEATFLM